MLAIAPEITASLKALESLGVVPGVAAGLAAQKDAIFGEMREAVLAEVPAYTESANPDVLPQLDIHLEQLVDEARRLLANKPAGDLAFVRAQAQTRAQQKFPLDAILLAYRCVHRVLSRSLRDSALEAADESAQVRRVVARATEFASEFTGAASTLLTAEYVAQTRRLAEAEGDLKTRLLGTLLEGYDEADPIAAQLLRRSGYLEQRQTYCVVFARSVDPREMENAARAQRMSAAFEDALATAPIRRLIGVRDNLVVAVLSGVRRQSGWTAAKSLLAERVLPHLRRVGPAAVIGFSNDVPSTAHIPRAANEARLALDHASVANRVVGYADIPFRQMLVSHARDKIQSALPAWLEAFDTADGKLRGAFRDTLEAYANANMNVLRTAKQLGVHPNTIYARMNRIRDLTGHNPLEYHALTEFLLVLDAKHRMNHGTASSKG